MAVIKSPFESRYGFKGPGFSVDELGNIIANSIITSVSGNTDIVDYIVTENSSTDPSAFIINGSEDESPSITIARSSSYTFFLDLPNTGFSLYEEDQITTYNIGLSHTDGTTGADAQGKTDGTLVFSVPPNAPDVLYYGDADRTFFGSINIIDPVGVFSTVGINETTASTSSTSGALTVAGGVGIAGDLYVAGSLNIDGIGITNISSPTNLELEAINQLIVRIDGNKIGVIGSNGSSIPVVDTTINNTSIGSTTPSTAAFTSATIAELPIADSSATNKQYVDSTVLSLSIAFGL